jgi:Undecaprenyl-phosphate glucose phosphotransferase
MDLAKLAAITFERDEASANRLTGFLPRWRVILLVQCLDVAAIVGTALLLFPLTGKSLAHLEPRYLAGALVAAVICHISFKQNRLYEIDALLDETFAIKSIMIQWGLLFLGLAAMTALARVPQAYSRLWFGGYFVFGAGALAAERLSVALALRTWIRRGYVMQSVVLVGANEAAASLIDRLARNRSGVCVTAVFHDDAEMAAGALRGTAIRGVPVLGGVDDLLEYAKTHPVDLVVLTLPISAAERLQAAVAKLRRQPLNIRVMPGEIGLDGISPIRIARDELPGVQLIAVANRPMSEFALFMKGAIDRVVAAVALLLLLPLFLLISIGIAISSPGPVIFEQDRVGYRGRVFKIYKFRTMDKTLCGSYAPTKRRDPRVFPFGQALRNLSLDELPQLVNVLRGDMSLVGPRPHMVGQTVDGKCFFEAVNEYAARHRVKPGITGWAQVNGWRGPTDTLEQVERRVEHDIFYIENWSLMLDLVIVLKTVFVGFFGKNAF